MPPTASRRWFRFSLRTLFILTTIFACWLAYQVKWIRDRREFLAERVEFFQTNLDFQWQVERGIRAPSGLWFFGEQGVKQLDLLIVISNQLPRESGEEDPMYINALKLFPEAQIRLSTITKEQLRIVIDDHRRDREKQRKRASHP